VTLQTHAPENFRSWRLGDEQTVKLAQTVSEDPDWREWKFANSFKCDYFGSKYKRKEQLEAHMTSTHEAVSEKFECDNCTKTFSTLNNKRRHFYTSIRRSQMLTL
jgi:uncharacterized Zn-finger protein